MANLKEKKRGIIKKTIAKLSGEEAQESYTKQTMAQADDLIKNIKFNSPTARKRRKLEEYDLKKKLKSTDYSKWR